MTEDEMVGWHHHQLNEPEFEQVLGDSEGQGSLASCSPWGCKEADTTKRLKNNNNTCINLLANADAPEDSSSIPGQEGNSNPLQHSCLGNLMDRGPCQAAVYGGHKESDMIQRLKQYRRLHSPTTQPLVTTTVPSVFMSLTFFF